MSNKTVTVVNGTPQQILTGRYHIYSVKGNGGTANTTVNFYDSVGATTTTAPALTVKQMTTGTRDADGIVDCAGISRDYDYPGVIYGTDVTIAGGSTALPILFSLTPNEDERVVDVITTLGLYAVHTGGTGTDSLSISLTKYEGNIPSN